MPEHSGEIQSLRKARSSDGGVRQVVGELVHAAALVQLQAELAGLHGEVVAGRALVSRDSGVGRATVARAGAAVAQHAARLDEALALVVAAARERQHGEVEALHALERELLELVQAEVATVGARVHLEVARAGARRRAGGGARLARVPRVARVAAHGARARRVLGLVERVLSRARLQLDRLGVVAQVARRHEHSRVLGGRATLRVLRVLRLGPLQLGSDVEREVGGDGRGLHGRRGRRAHAGHDARPEPTRVVRRRQLLEY